MCRTRCDEGVAEEPEDPPVVQRHGVRTVGPEPARIAVEQGVGFRPRFRLYGHRGGLVAEARACAANDEDEEKDSGTPQSHG